jgi:hypothetical protein
VISHKHNCGTDKILKFPQHKQPLCSDKSHDHTAECQNKPYQMLLVLLNNEATTCSRLESFISQLPHIILITLLCICILCGVHEYYLHITATSHTFTTKTHLYVPKNVSAYISGHIFLGSHPY